MKAKKIDIGKPKKRHKSVSKKTVNILMGVLKYFAEENLRLDMRDWGTFYPKAAAAYNPDFMPPCRTRACLAGGIMLTTEKGLAILKERGLVKSKARFDEISFDRDTPISAAKILGIKQNAADRLFYFKGWLNDQGWPDNYADAYREAASDSSPEGMFEATKNRVFHFIETGE